MSNLLTLTDSQKAKIEQIVMRRKEETKNLAEELNISIDLAETLLCEKQVRKPVSSRKRSGLDEFKSEWYSKHKKNIRDEGAATQLSQEWNALSDQEKIMYQERAREKEENILAIADSSEIDKEIKKALENLTFTANHIRQRCNSETLIMIVPRTITCGIPRVLGSDIGVRIGQRLIPPVTTYAELFQSAVQSVNNHLGTYINFRMYSYLN